MKKAIKMLLFTALISVSALCITACDGGKTSSPTHDVEESQTAGSSDDIVHTEEDKIGDLFD